MKRLRSLFFAVLLLGALTSPAWADNGDRGLDHRGSDHGFRFDRIIHGNVDVLTFASGRAAGGRADSKIAVSPAGGTSQSVITCSNIPTQWDDPLAHSNWVSLQADCTTALADSTNYVYSTTFNLPPNHAAARIDGQVMADDSVTIQLNGTTIFSGGGFGSPTAFSSNDASLFLAGTNTLTFTVFNVTGASGLDYVARVEAAREFPVFTHDGDNGDN
jgi:hypothetical protein